MKLKINREFLRRHLFSLSVFVVLGGWFGFDAFVRYPRSDARALYVSIEKSWPGDNVDLESFKAQKVQTQRLMASFALLAASLVGLHLLCVARFRFEFDDAGFSIGDRRFKYSDIKDVDRSKWEEKGVLTVSGDGFKIRLDAWHHIGVKEFHSAISENSNRTTR